MSLPAGWIGDAEALCASGRPSPLEVVDLLRRVPRYASGRVSELARLTGFSYGHVSSLAWVAARNAADVRRDVPLSVYFVVAKLPPAEQRRWVDEAAAESLSGPALCRRIAAEAGR
jgi:hypothetical protein